LQPTSAQAARIEIANRGIIDFIRFFVRVYYRQA